LSGRVIEKPIYFLRKENRKRSRAWKNISQHGRSKIFHDREL
jgi:hypothetical protein